METLLSELKEYLNIEPGNTDFDAMLRNMINVSMQAISLYCNGGIEDYISKQSLTNMYEIPTIKMAILQYSAHLFLNRTIVTMQQAFELPLTFKFLLNPYIKY